MTNLDSDGPGSRMAADARPDEVDPLLAASGRLAWLEAMRQASRVVRHDLANVLTGISFFGSELAAEFPDGTTGARNAAAIADEVEHGARLLERLLLLWRDPPEADVLPLDAAAVVDALLPLLTVLAAPSELAVGPLDSIVVRTSRRALEEALLVLVLDARGVGGSIRVSVEAVAGHPVGGEPAGRAAAICVAHDCPAADAGAGESASPAALVGAPGQLGIDPALGLALAAAAARLGGGTVDHVSQDAGTGVTTMLLPEAVSRRRRLATQEGAGGGG